MANTAPDLAERRVMAQQMARPADLAPTSWNAEARTIDVIWTTGARGARFSWEEFDVVDEELDTGSRNVRLERLNAGAPVLDTHRRGGLVDQIGTVIPGSARMEAGRGVATLRLSDRPELATIVGDIAAGIIRNLSVGYKVHEYLVERLDGQRPLYRAVDWEPLEISFVPVPFDAGAQTRSNDAAQGGHPCTIRPSGTVQQEYRSMTQPGAGEGGAVQPPNANIVRFSAKQAMEFVSQARAFGARTCTRAEELIDLNDRGEITIEAARASILQHAASEQRAQTGGVGAGGGDVVTGHASFDNPAFRSSAIGDAIYARLSGKTPSEPAREFMNMNLVRMAGWLAERAGVRGVHAMSPDEVLNVAAWNQRGMSGIGPGASTSDFPQLLLGSGERFFIQNFTSAESPLKVLCKRRLVTDFREISALQLSGGGTLKKMTEGGEFESTSFSERKEAYRVETWGRNWTLTREAIINDDLGAFSDMMTTMGRMAALTEAKVLADLLTSNPVMGDGKALFHADHGNIASPSASPTVASFDAGRVLMRSQKDLDGVTPYDARPKYVVSSVGQEGAVEAILKGKITATKVEDVNQFSGEMEPVSDPRLSGNRWYMFADPNVAPVLEYAQLAGKEGPHIESKEGWSTLGTSWRCYHDFGFGVVDWRGAMTNPGA